MADCQQFSLCSSVPTHTARQKDGGEAADRRSSRRNGDAAGNRASVALGAGRAQPAAAGSEGDGLALGQWLGFGGAASVLALWVFSRPAVSSCGGSEAAVLLTAE